MILMRVEDVTLVIVDVSWLVFKHTKVRTFPQAVDVREGLGNHPRSTSRLAATRRSCSILSHCCIMMSMNSAGFMMPVTYMTLRILDSSARSTVFSPYFITNSSREMVFL